MVNNLRGVLTRAGFSDSELKLLRGVVVSLDYFSPKTPRGSGAPEGRKREKPVTKNKADKPNDREDISGDE
jgi:tRNA/rRNA methyltransferase